MSNIVPITPDTWVSNVAPSNDATVSKSYQYGCAELVKGAKFQVLLEVSLQGQWCLMAISSKAATPKQAREQTHATYAKLSMPHRIISITRAV